MNDDHYDPKEKGGVNKKMKTHNPIGLKFRRLSRFGNKTLVVLYSKKS